MLARMDIISVNCPHTPATYHLLSARRLKLIRKDAYIVNTARGGVIDEDTLVKLLEAGDVGGAGLDVYEHEPAVNPKLVRLAKAGKVTLLHGLGHDRRPRRDGREGDHQYPDLPRQPQAAGPRAAQHALIVHRTNPHGEEARQRRLEPVAPAAAARHPRRAKTRSSG